MRLTGAINRVPSYPEFGAFNKYCACLIQSSHCLSDMYHWKEAWPRDVVPTQVSGGQWSPSPRVLSVSSVQSPRANHFISLCSIFSVVNEGLTKNLPPRKAGVAGMFIPVLLSVTGS